MRERQRRPEFSVNLAVAPDCTGCVMLGARENHGVCLCPAVSVRIPFVFLTAEASLFFTRKVTDPPSPN